MGISGNMTDFFENKIVLIVGGASGMGRATALEAAARGAKVTIADLSDEFGNALSREYANISFKKADITSAQDCKHLAEFIQSEHGQLDFICNSAGLQTYGTVDTTSEEDWDRSLNVNLKGMFLVIKSCVDLMRNAGGGAIVNISSVQAMSCQENVLAYATSKGAVVSMTRSMALDLAKDNIRVNCICPGSVDTPMLRYGASKHGELDKVLKEWGDFHPIGRIGKAEEIAKTVLFLWSPDSAFMLGQSLVVDGGLISKIL
ncbi:MAG: SDR family oxidoreductase [Cyclobacteriaceae bacterium]